MKTLTDRAALIRNRNRARRDPAMFLHQAAADELKDRLEMVNKSFKDMAIITGFADFWQNAFPQATCRADDEVLDLPEAGFDLILHAMALHWANDPVGQLIQARRALRPDGLLLAVFFGGETLHELRASLAQAEAEVVGGLSPRIAPMGEIRDLGALLQRAGFALPVADSIPLKVSYKSPRHLMHDLRAMGETNALSGRPRKMTRPALMARAEQIYTQAFGDKDRINATFELIILTGWSPDESQQKPLRPGSATTRLAQALGTHEAPLKD
jgi:SAM-dependent methyltransferase